MTFPVVEASTSSIDATADTTAEVALPGGIVTGELLIGVVAARFDRRPFVWPSGWTSFGNFVRGVECCVEVAWREATGGESSPITVSWSGNSESACQSFRISGALDPGTTPPEAGGAADGGSGDPDPAAFTPGFGQRDTLWIALCSLSQGPTVTGTVDPNYTNLMSTVSQAVSSGVTLGTARRSVNAATQDPEPGFTVSATQQWLAGMVAIPGSEGGGEPPEADPVGRSTIIDLAQGISVVQGR